MTSSNETAGGLPPLIPRAVLFGNPERTSPHFSPDGQYFAYLAPDENDVLQVWVRTRGKDDARKVTMDPKRGIRSYFWTYEEGQLVYLQDSDGDENWHLYAVDIHSNQVRDLTPFEGVQARVTATEPGHPHEILVAMNLRDREVHDLHRLNLVTGGIELEMQNPGRVISWTADAEMTVRAALATTEDGGQELLLRDDPRQPEPAPVARAPWRVARHWGPDDEGGPTGFSADGRTLYLIENLDSDTNRLVAFDTESGETRVLAEDPEYDLGGLLVHPVTKVIEAAGFSRERLEWKVLDDSVREDFERIAKIRDGEYRVASRDLSDKTWLIACTTDDGPVYYYSYDRETRQSEFLFTSQPKLEGLPLAHTEPIRFQARDGLTIHGYLTTPPGVPPKDLPTVLHVHGGPWGRDTWGFHPVVQLLANRGYAVLKINYRGSAGYGKAFLNAGNREWARKMHEDLIDGVNWIVAQGIADPKRVAIMGGSYGGYATLVGLTFTPDVFAVGVDLVGPSNLLTLLHSIPPYWKPMMSLFAHRVGPLEDEAFLKSRSPLFLVDKIRAPLLIGQGANDPRVKQSASEQIVEAMRAKDKPVEYIVYSDEGHGFRRPENNLHFYAHAEQFLATHLGGRAEPVGEIKGHSGTVR